MSNHRFAGELALLTTAFIWGSGFIGVDYCLDAGFPRGMVNMLRFFIGAVAIMLIINKDFKTFTKAEIKTGAIAGFFFFIGFLFQAIGMQTIEVSSNALLTATNLLMVPFIARICFKEKIAFRVYIAVFVCFFGMAVLNWKEGGIHFSPGDILTLICAFGFACHIAYLGHAGGHKNSLHLTFMPPSVLYQSVCHRLSFRRLFPLYRNRSGCRNPLGQRHGSHYLLGVIPHGPLLVPSDLWPAPHSYLHQCDSSFL